MRRESTRLRAGLRLLLAVMSLQAVTPDSRDLASRWLLHEFAGLARPAGPAGDGGATDLVAVDAPAHGHADPQVPLRSDLQDRERTPDEVCTKPAMHTFALAFLSPVFPLEGPGRVVGPVLRRFQPRRAEPPGDGSPLLFGRLTC
ncbi:MAG: hypothetical protein U0835_21650 [Isosphaeraceae bacterium]